MPFDVKCDGCGRRFRAPDKLVGKRVKCPQCHAAILVGAAPERPADKSASPSSESASPSSVSPARSSKKLAVAKPVSEVKPLPDDAIAEWHMQTGDGQEFGPVSKKELDSWAAEGRLDSQCQVLKDGWDQWKWADDVYPELAEPAPPGPPVEPQNPFAGFSEAAPPTSVNPFASPHAAPAAVTTVSAGEGPAITPRIRRALADTKPWVTFLAILGFVVGGLGAVVPLIMMFIALAAGSMPTMLLSLLMAVGPALYLVAAYYLLTYGSRIGGFLRSGEVGELEQAMLAQKSFWKLVGVITVVVLALYLVAVMLIFAMGGLAAMAIHSPAKGG